MTYRCGIGPGLGIEAGPPQVACDGPGCDAIIIVSDRAPAWLRNGTAPPGWLKVPKTEFTISHYCPKCKVAQPRGKR